MSHLYTINTTLSFHLGNVRTQMKNKSRYGPSKNNCIYMYLIKTSLKGVRYISIFVKAPSWSSFGELIYIGSSLRFYILYLRFHFLFAVVLLFVFSFSVFCLKPYILLCILCNKTNLNQCAWKL